MYQNLLVDATFFDLLLRFDEELAARVQAAGCACGGRLHRADYERKPRGGPPGLGAEYEVRFSFCCAAEGCRRRSTPPSLRFLGRKVYYGAVVVLAPVLLRGPSARRCRPLQQLLGVSTRTLRRWCRFWTECVAGSRWFAAARGRFATPVAAEGLPRSALEAFTGLTAAERLVAMLRWLGALSVGGSCSRAG